MGFFSKKLNGNGDPVKLILSPDVYYFPGNISFVSFTTSLVKARDADTYLLRRMNTNEYPNLCITRDFKTYKKITNLEPHKKYNWLTSEPLQWKSYDGHTSDGIMYKPEDFNPNKKYPVIFLIYERWSYGLNKYLNFELSQAALNVPFFVSNGYIVVCPDIYYKIGNTAESAYNYVVSAVEAVSKLPYVDSKSIGLQGHSYGAFETNYLITRTNLFAAAASAAGVTDYVSNVATFKMQCNDAHDYAKYNQDRLGVTLWEDRETYIKNSAVFYADKVTTPLLIMHSVNDYVVPWPQSIEYFTSLRYLNKMVWMLHYDNGSHTLSDPVDQLDYTTRMMQFFNHYLKKQPAPKWMTQGRPAKLKQIDDRFELDPDGSCGKNCVICNKVK